MTLLMLGFPIRRSPDNSLLTATRSLSQSSTSFIGNIRLGIHFVPLSTFLCIDLTSNCYLHNYLPSIFKKFFLHHQIVKKLYSHLERTFPLHLAYADVILSAFQEDFLQLDPSYHQDSTLSRDFRCNLCDKKEPPRFTFYFVNRQRFLGTFALLNTQYTPFICRLQGVLVTIFCYSS